MPSTTVHVPEQLLAKIDQVVKEKKISRNRFIIEACEQSLNNEAGQWPKGFFENELSNEELRMLNEGVTELEKKVIRMRKSRRVW